MNILGLVFSILLILSFGFYACWDKMILTRKIDATFIGQANVSRQLQNAYESQIYNRTGKLTEFKGKKEKKEKPEKEEKEIPEPPKINPECARFNLWLLIEKGRESQRLLYDQLAHMLRLFYKDALFPESPRLEYRFLDTWIAHIKLAIAESSNQPILLEKIDLKNPSLQILYYHMLRGAEGKYPVLLDFVKVAQMSEKSPEKLCLTHATPEMLSVFFGKAAEAVYKELHGENLAVTNEIIEDICRRHSHTLFDNKIFDLVAVTTPKHNSSNEMILVEEDEATKISFRRKVQMTKL
ncbi:MAG: hypothetical protein JSS32_00840 [Verrucomicrobia bacterium]|nr:hypothetical protein [Verrucomicrobiota bacterium]